MGLFTVKAIIPSDVFADAKKIGRAVETTFNNAARGVKADFDVTTQTWAKRPAFTITQDGPGSRTVSTEDEIYGYVNDGTPPHLISANKAPMLRWRTPFRAKTRPRWIGSNKGSLGNQYRRALVVHHPGTQAREFDEVIWKKWDQQFPILLQRAIDAEVD